MIKVYFKEVVDYYDNGCSCCEPMETTEYTLVDYPNDLSEDLHNKLMDSCRDTSEQYRCLVNTSYVFSNTSLEYYEYVDWCYNLFNYEQMEELLKQDDVEVLFLWIYLRELNALFYLTHRNEICIINLIK